MRSPTFIIIGVSKCGATALYHQLRQHPSIFMPKVKETQYFTYRLPRKELNPDWKLRPTNLEEYQALFADVRDETAIGEASPAYFNEPPVAARIHEYDPKMKLIVSLRHPVDRAESHYMMVYSWGSLPDRRFSDLVRERLLNNPSWIDEPYDAYYCKTSLYYDGLKRYLDLFPREQVMVIKYDDLLDSASSTYERIFQFLDVDPSFPIDATRRFHVGVEPRNVKLLHTLTQPNLAKTLFRSLLPKSVRRKIVYQVRRKYVKPKQPLDPNDRREFMSLFRDDVLKTQELTGLDLSDWLEG
jgi:hypothetical protein